MHKDKGMMFLISTIWLLPLKVMFRPYLLVSFKMFLTYKVHVHHDSDKDHHIFSILI